MTMLAPIPAFREAVLAWNRSRAVARMQRVAAALDSLGLTVDDDADETLDREGMASHRFLGFYGGIGLKSALQQYGLWTDLQDRIGGEPVLVIDRVALGDRVRIASAEGLLFVELVARLEERHDMRLLHIEWLLLQDPRRSFPPGRRALPGQVHPGLGRGRELMILLMLMAKRLRCDGLEGVPSWFHNATMYHLALRFLDGAEEGRFLALQRATSHLDLGEATRALHEGRVLDMETGDAVGWRPGTMRAALTDRAVFQNEGWTHGVEKETTESRFHVQ